MNNITNIKKELNDMSIAAFHYKVIRMVGNVDMVVENIKTKKEYLISRYQIME